MLNAAGQELKRKVEIALDMATKRGIFITYIPSRGGRERNQYSSYNKEFLLNTTQNRAALLRNGQKTPPEPLYEIVQSQETDNSAGLVWRIYEENISAITPIVADNIKDALSKYSEQEIIDAIYIAVNANARNWKYISSILQRQEKQKINGQYTSTSKKDVDEFIQEYLKRQRARGNT